MENKKNMYFAVAYKLYTNENGTETMVEEATAEKPFQFLSGFGLALDDFENTIVALNDEQKNDFDFTLTKQQAYGEHEAERVLNLDKEMFCIDGKLDTAQVKAFRAPAGTLVEVYATTLHYTPCMVDDGGFQVMVALPAGTNGPRPEAAADMPAAGDSYCYWKADKWVLCHADSPKAAEGGYVGLVGKNLDITVD